MSSDRKSLAIVYAAGASADTVALSETRYSRVADAISQKGIEISGIPYSDDRLERVRQDLAGVDGALVWVNPIEHGRDRSVLNFLLSEIAAKGVFVSAHPETIDKIGTKEVLHSTRSMTWGTDTRHYQTLNEMRAELPQSLRTTSARVLKKVRGSSADGIWKVELSNEAGHCDLLSPSDRLRVRPAKRGSVEEEPSWAEFLSGFEPYFASGGTMIDQVYQPRISDGMVRCYLVRDRVVGFGEQKINALYPAPEGKPTSAAPEPGPRLYYPPTRPDFQPLKRRLEQEWLGELCNLTALQRSDLPIIWDADFMYGPKDADGADTYVLCEINTSCVSPFPDEALPVIAAETAAELDRRG